MKLFQAAISFFILELGGNLRLLALSTNRVKILSVDKEIKRE